MPSSPSNIITVPLSTTIEFSFWQSSPFLARDMFYQREFMCVWGGRERRFYSYYLALYFFVEMRQRIHNYRKSLARKNSTRSLEGTSRP